MDTCIEDDGKTSFVHRFRLTDEVYLSGYKGYSVLNSAHFPDLQQLRTIKTASIHQVRHCLACMPGLAQLLMSAAKQMGMKVEVSELHLYVLHIHFLYLDSTSQVDFGWHEDTYDLSISEKKRDGMISVIVQLSTSFSTALQICGFPYFEYKGQGSGVIFLGRSLHRSISREIVPSHYGVWKVAAFMHPTPCSPRNAHISNVHDVC